MNYQFPQFRKLANNKSFYKIESAFDLVELQQLGSRWNRFVLKAKILPERILIDDMLALSDGHYVEIPEQEFETVMSEWKQQKR